MTEFALPKNCMGFDALAAEVPAAKQRFAPWLHSFANAQSRDVRVLEVESAATQSFTVFQLDGLGVWVLHNNWSSVIGAVESEPKAGFAYAVDAPFVAIDVPEFLKGWGPVVPTPGQLNAELTDNHWQNITLTDRNYADKFKPTKPSHVLFNYWD